VLAPLVNRHPDAVTVTAVERMLSLGDDDFVRKVLLPLFELRPELIEREALNNLIAKLS
jgi:hypothetical protein